MPYPLVVWHCLGVCAVERMDIEGFPVRVRLGGRLRSIAVTTRRKGALKSAEVGNPQTRLVLPRRLLGRGSMAITLITTAALNATARATAVRLAWCAIGAPQVSWHRCAASSVDRTTPLGRFTAAGTGFA
jgi:hypothetical protein